MTRSEAPHAKAIRENSAELRQQVVDEYKQRSEMLPQMLKVYDDAIAGLETQLADVKDDENSAEQVASLESMIQTYRDAKESVSSQLGAAEATKTEELTDEQIDEMVKSSMQYEDEGGVDQRDSMTPCSSPRSVPVGYGYEVWRTDAEFADGKKIVSDLSGCCGQMDVQANADGVFVAENSRHRVRRFDADGKLDLRLGQGARRGSRVLAAAATR